MAYPKFEHVLAAARRLSRDEQQKLAKSLLEQPQPQPKKKPGRRVPSPVPSKDRTLEDKWLAEHSREFAGKWVALEGGQMIACGSSAVEVSKAAKAAGIERPILVQVEDPDGLPFVGGGV